MSGLGLDPLEAEATDRMIEACIDRGIEVGLYALKFTKWTTSNKLSQPKHRTYIPVKRQTHSHSKTFPCSLDISYGENNKALSFDLRELFPANPLDCLNRVFEATAITTALKPNSSFTFRVHRKFEDNTPLTDRVQLTNLIPELQPAIKRFTIRFCSHECPTWFTRFIPEQGSVHIAAVLVKEVTPPLTEIADFEADILADEYIWQPNSCDSLRLDSPEVCDHYLSVLYRLLDRWGKNISVLIEADECKVSNHNREAQAIGSMATNYSLFLNKIAAFANTIGLKPIEVLIENSSAIYTRDVSPFKGGYEGYEQQLFAGDDYFGTMLRPVLWGMTTVSQMQAQINRFQNFKYIMGIHSHLYDPQAKALKTLLAMGYVFDVMLFDWTPDAYSPAVLTKFARDF